MRRLVSVLAVCSFIIATACAGAQAQSVVERPDGPLQTGPSSGFTGNSLVSEARRYIGSNPTGSKSLWCGAFMDLVLKRTGHQGGGHVGVVTGVDPNGNPIVLSGNTWNRSTGGKRTVSEAVYPKGRVYAYVMP